MPSVLRFTVAPLPLAIGSGDLGREVEGPMATVVLGTLYLGNDLRTWHRFWQITGCSEVTVDDSGLDSEHIDDGQASVFKKGARLFEHSCPSAFIGTNPEVLVSR